MALETALSRATQRSVGRTYLAGDLRMVQACLPVPTHHPGCPWHWSLREIDRGIENRHSERYSLNLWSGHLTKPVIPLTMVLATRLCTNVTSVPRAFPDILSLTASLKRPQGSSHAKSSSNLSPRARWSRAARCYRIRARPAVVRRCCAAGAAEKTAGERRSEWRPSSEARRNQARSSHHRRRNAATDHVRHGFRDFRDQRSCGF